MNYTESFDQFASRLGPTDLALYAGAGIIIWILFKDKLSPVKEFILSLFKKRLKTEVSEKKISTDSILTHIFDDTTIINSVSPTIDTKEDLFFQLVSSWKQTRDLAVKNGCTKAVEVADQMFPFLSPSVCKEGKENE